ncbi:MAG: lamin tail domain-containing protein, partial [Anaerolineae bacterium]
MHLRLGWVLTGVLLSVSLAGNPWRPSGPDDARAIYLPIVTNGVPSGTPALVISALYYDTTISGEPDEAFQIYNPGDTSVPLAGWRLTNGTQTVAFPDGYWIPGRSKLWCAR